MAYHLLNLLPVHQSVWLRGVDAIVPTGGHHKLTAAQDTDLTTAHYLLAIRTYKQMRYIHVY